MKLTGCIPCNILADSLVNWAEVEQVGWWDRPLGDHQRRQIPTIQDSPCGSVRDQIALHDCMTCANFVCLGWYLLRNPQRPRGSRSNTYTPHVRGTDFGLFVTWKVQPMPLTNRPNRPPEHPGRHPGLVPETSSLAGREPGRGSRGSKKDH